MRLRSLADLPANMRLVRQTQPDVMPTPIRKYRNQPVIEDGQRFDSKLEAACYRNLKMHQRAGIVLWFIRQVPFHLEGGVVYRADFLAVLASGDVEVIDAKGKDTQVSKNKRKQVKARYGVEVKLWTK